MPKKRFTTSAPEIGVLIYTHERTDDARINMEIIRSLWGKSGLFSHVVIAHAFNGKTSWYPKKYLEDILVRRKNYGHLQGAADLIDTGVAALQKRYPRIRYAVVLAADTWCVKPAYIRRTIDRMRVEDKVWATCPWGLPSRFDITDVGMATDFFCLDVQWAKKFRFFPLKYAQFAKRFGTLISYLSPWSNVSVEKLIRARFANASFRQFHDNLHRRELANKQILQLKERMPVHSTIMKSGYWKRRFYWPAIGLITHHDPKQKASILKHEKGLHGPHSKRLISARDLSYYNGGRESRRSYN